MSLVRFRFWARRCSSMVEHQPSKLNTWVRFPSPALKMNILFIMREWLSWWSTTLPRSGSRVRVPSRALLIYKRYPKRIPFVYKRVLPDSNGSYLRSTSVGANGSPMDFQHPVSRNEGLRWTRTVRGLRSAPVGAEPTSTGCRAPSRAMKDSAGLERFVSSFHFGRCRIVFFSFIRDEGVAGAFFSVTSQHTGHWPGLF